MTRNLCNLNFLAKLMVLHRHILFNLAIAVFAEAILMRISAEHRHPYTGCSQVVETGYIL